MVASLPSSASSWSVCALLLCVCLHHFEYLFVFVEQQGGRQLFAQMVFGAVAPDQALRDLTRSRIGTALQIEGLYCSAVSGIV